MSLNFIAVFFLVVFTCMISLLVGVISFGNSLGRSAEEFCHHRPVQCTRFVEQSRLLSVIIWPSFQFQWCHSAQQPSLPIEQLLNSLDTFRLLLSLSKWHSSARLLCFGVGEAIEPRPTLAFIVGILLSLCIGASRTVHSLWVSELGRCHISFCQALYRSFAIKSLFLLSLFCMFYLSRVCSLGHCSVAHSVPYPATTVLQDTPSHFSVELLPPWMLGTRLGGS